MSRFTRRGYWRLSYQPGPSPPLLAVGTTQKIGNFNSAAFVGLVLLAMVVCNLSMLPYPIWFKVVTPIAILAAAILGIRWSRPKIETTGRAEV